MDGGSTRENLESRIERVLRDEIEIVDYDPDWPRLFEVEARYLRAVLPAGSIGRVEHFGSTAIPGMPAKPIVDMLIETRSLEETQQLIVPELESRGYDYFWRTDVPAPYSWFIKRDERGRRTHHLHMDEAGSSLWERLLFRDYLREFPFEARLYDELKRRLAREHRKDRIAYTQGKTDFVVSMTEAAKRYYNRES